MINVTEYDIKSFSIFDENYIYNVKYLGYSFSFSNKRDVDCVNSYKLFLESHGKIYYFKVVYGLTSNEYELLKLELHELKRPLNKLKNGFKRPEGCKKRYVIKHRRPLITAKILSDIFSNIMCSDFYESSACDFFDELGDCSQNDLADYINHQFKLGR